MARHALALRPGRTGVLPPAQTTTGTLRRRGSGLRMAAPSSFRLNLLTAAPGRSPCALASRPRVGSARLASPLAPTATRGSYGKRGTADGGQGASASGPGVLRL